MCHPTFAFPGTTMFTTWVIHELLRLISYHELGVI